MVKVNFSIPKQLDQKIEKVKEDKGFMSKSEFFRYVMISYIEENENYLFGDDKEISELVNKIEDKIDNAEDPSSLKEQLGLNE